MERKKVTIQDLQAKKQRGEKITRLQAYDYPMAVLLEKAGVDMILVGDSLGMVFLGYQNTLPVTMEEMLHHCKAVARGAKPLFWWGTSRSCPIRPASARPFATRAACSRRAAWMP